MDKDQQTARGTRARELLENETFQAAIVDVRQSIYDDWVRTGQAEAGKRETLHAQYVALERIETKLRAWREEAATIAKALAQEDRARKR